MSSSVMGSRTDFSASQPPADVDLFLENCSSLYSLILDCLQDVTFKDPSCESLQGMCDGLYAVGKELIVSMPDFESTIGLRLKTISSAMEQLRLRSSNATNTATSDSEWSTRSQPSCSVRSWLHSVERRLNELEERLLTCGNFTKLLADHQVLQLEIQTEGQTQISRLTEQAKSCSLDELSGSESRSKDKRRAAVEVLRKRWHELYLNSLVLQLKIEDRLNRAQEEEDSESDPELASPPSKRKKYGTLERKGRRRRLGEGSQSEESSAATCPEDDTVPFDDSEYESLMDGRVTSLSSEESCTAQTPGQAKKWDSALLQDVGYSSGDNSVHEHLNTLALLSLPVNHLNQRVGDCSPLKALYKTVQIDDASDTEANKTTTNILDLTAEEELSMSMYVSHDLRDNDIMSSLTEYDEVMALLDESGAMNNEVDSNDSFNTQWREIRGEDKRKKPKSGTEKEDTGAKHSCDASSEESSDCEEKMMEQIMNRSFTFANDYSATTSTPLKRHRSQRGLKTSGNCLFDSDMAASFCSTRSDFSSRGRRKRLRVRRLPRSLSDGEQLSTMTGAILSSPPTPLASSTRLLQQLDEQLQASNKDSDTQGDSSDVQVYEWDDYNPPAKDESIHEESGGMVTPTKQSQLHLLSQDDDFSSHFNAEMKLHTLVEASKAHLQIVEDSLKHVDESQIENIRLISRTNIRQLDAAMKMQRNLSESEMHELAQLRVQWAKLLHRIENPMPQLLDKVEQFANSLRDLHERSSVSALNGVNEIRTKEDVRLALMAMCQIEERLSQEKDELKQLLSSRTVAKEIEDLSSEFNAISDGYEEAVERMRKMVETLKGVDRLWTEWNDRQIGIRCAMQKIENEMEEDGFDQQKIIHEIGLCEERLNSLETMCNYLTSALYSLQDSEASNAGLPDFHSEMRIYTNALKELKHRLHELLRVPSPPSPSVPPEPSPTLRKRRSERHTQTIMLSSLPVQSPPSRCLSTRSIVFLSLLSTFVLLYLLGIYGFSFGPHLTYVRGPPPT